jgi:hypothetical protein
VAASWTDVQSSTNNTTEVVKVLDFGISRFLDPAMSSAKLTSTGVVMGTPYYMAPEQIREMGSVDGRADLFAVGIILYECLTGKLPFTGDNIHSLLHHVLVEPAPDPSLSNPHIPEGLVAVVLRALEKNPNERFQSADEFIAALRPFHDATSTDSWSGRPFESRADKIVDDAGVVDKKTIALATGDLTPVVPSELAATVHDTAPTDGPVLTEDMSAPQIVASSDEPVAPELVPARSPRSAPLLVLLGVGVLVACLVLGYVVALSMSDAVSDDVDRATINPSETSEPVNPAGSTGETGGHVEALGGAQDAGRSTVDATKQVDSGDVQPDGTERTKQNVNVDSTLSRARECLRRRDGECCLSALEGVPRTGAVKAMLRRCRGVRGRQIKRQANATDRPPSSTGKSRGSDVPVARDAPW